MLLLDALQQTLLFLPLCFGIYLSYRILNVIDLTVDGTFVLGAAIFAKCIACGYGEGLSIVFSLSGGFFAGVIVACIQRYANISALITSILAVFMLYSVNFFVMQQPNISLLNHPLLLDGNASASALLIGLIIFSLALIIILVRVLSSSFGLSMRAFGVNAKLLQTIGKRPTLYLIIGLGLANCLAALCGSMTAEMNGYADINMGIGMALTAVGSVAIGEKIIQTIRRGNHKFSALFELLGCLLGAYVYFLAMNLFLSLGVNPVYLKLLLGIVLIVFLSLSNVNQKKGYYDAAIS